MIHRSPGPVLFLAVAFLAGCGSLLDKPADEAPGNLLANGSFEVWGDSGPPGWEIDQSGRNERLDPDGDSCHGNIAAGVTCLHPDDFVVLSQTVAVQQPGLYRAHVYLRTLMPLRGCFLIVETVDRAGRKQEAARRELRGQLGEWRPVSCTAVVPEGTIALRFLLRVGPGATGDASFDAARLDWLQ